MADNYAPNNVFLLVIVNYLTWLLPQRWPVTKALLTLGSESRDKTVKIMKPTIGRIVIFNTTESQREQFTKDFDNAPEQLPAVIVRVWSDTCINLKVITDGKADLWVTSALQGSQQGNWDWPVIAK